MKTNIDKILKEFSKINGTRFIYLKNYYTDIGEISNYTILVGSFLKNSYEKDLRFLKRYKCNSIIEEIAKKEIINSINNSLNNGIGKNDAYKKIGYYTHIDRNIKYHIDEITDAARYYINGFKVRKEVIRYADKYKKVNFSEKTIAKNELNRLLRRGKFREFIIDSMKVEEIHLNGNKLTVKYKSF